MKGLAEFALRGRLQALALAVIGAGSLLFCWLSAAVIALITLRKGAGEGTWLLVWALLPAGTVLYVYGDSGPLALLVGTWVLALVLRYTVSLPLALLVSVPVALVTGLLLLAFAGDYLDLLVARFGEFTANFEQQMSQSGVAVVAQKPAASQIAGMLGVGTATMSIMCLLLARYWQAALYNPGGFGEEFRALYLPATVSTALVIAALGAATLGLQYQTWAMMFFVPLTFVGLALVHARVAFRGQSGRWLGWFYVIWALLDPVKLIVVFFAIADSWINFRQRWAQKAGRDQGNGSGNGNGPTDQDRQ